MKSKIEDLVIELWLEIFNYLSISQQFNGFFNLNQRINQILFSYRTQISCKHNDENSQYLIQNILPYLKNRENVTCLRLENTNKIDLSNKKDLLYFPYLKILILHRLNITKDILNIFQQNTINLRYLNISSTISGNKQSMHKLFEMILSLQNLHTCYIRLGISMSPIQIKISLKSSIKILYLIGMNEDCSIDRLMNLFQYLPCLQSLYIITNQLISFTSITNIENIKSISISNFTLNINQSNISFIQFRSFIKTIVPCVQELKIILRNPLETLTYLDHYEWGILVQSLYNLKKLTLKINHASGINEQIWDKHCQKLTKLMSRNCIIFHMHK